MKPRVTPKKDYYGFYLWTWLERVLPSYAKCYLDSAFAGDEGDAFKICVADRTNAGDVSRWPHIILPSPILRTGQLSATYGITIINPSWQPQGMTDA